jgi:hypothetical protein
MWAGFLLAEGYREGKCSQQAQKPLFHITVHIG